MHFENFKDALSCSQDIGPPRAVGHSGHGHFLFGSTGWVCGALSLGTTRGAGVCNLKCVLCGARRFSFFLRADLVLTLCSLVPGGYVPKVPLRNFESCARPCALKVVRGAIAVPRSIYIYIYVCLCVFYIFHTWIESVALI